MKNSISFSFLLFTGFMVIGYSVSALFFHSDFGDYPNTASLITGSKNSILHMNNGQRSILLIGVDTIDTSNPKLTSLWLVTYLPSDSILHILPIFPAGNNNLSTYEVELSRSFTLDIDNSDLVLSQNFIKILEANNYWWSGYFIFDNFVMTRILKFFDDETMIGDINFGNQAIKVLSNVVDDPQSAYMVQLEMLQTVCQRLAGLTQKPDWSQITSLIPSHLLTDLNIQQFLLEWEVSLSSGRAPNCRFPTLEMSGIIK